MNKLSKTKRAQVVAALVEGNSIRSTVRLTGVCKKAVLKLLVDLGKACADYQDRTLRNLHCTRIQCDEIFSFCYAKDKNLPAELKGKFGFGSTWTWMALCADTKLVPCYLVGDRTGPYARKFIQDLASRLASRIQLTTDGYKAYINAVEDSFAANVDYAMLDKIYSMPQTEEARRYSPGECCGTRKLKITGAPDMAHVSTSFVERQNLTMRMHMRRFTRLTNAFSKKLENHRHAVALHYMYYNFAKVHQTLRVTPAMEAGVSDHVWSIEEIVGLIDRK